MLFHRDSRAESSRIRRGIEHDRDHLAPRNTLVQSLANLAHHCDVEDVERRPRESNPRDALVNVESDALIFLRHSELVILIEKGLTTVISLNRLKSLSLKVKRCLRLCTFIAATMRASWACFPAN